MKERERERKRDRERETEREKERKRAREREIEAKRLIYLDRFASQTKFSCNIAKSMLLLRLKTKPEN